MRSVGVLHRNLIPSGSSDFKVEDIHFGLQFIQFLSILSMNTEAQMQKSQQIYTIKNNIVKFELVLSDSLRHFYNDETKQLDESLLSLPVHSAVLYEKQLDHPLSWIEKTAATILNIKTKHQFVVFKLKDADINGSVDFYNSNRVVVRLGNMDTIAEGTSSGKRKQSVIVGHQPIAVTFSEADQKKVTLGQLVQIIYEVTPGTGHSKISNSCYHFSRNLIEQMRRQKAGEQSVIQKKLVKKSVKFGLK